jgi:RNA polymerase sigma-70 factor (ECF subfamily)
MISLYKKEVLVLAVVPGTIKDLRFNQGTGMNSGEGNQKATIKDYENRLAGLYEECYDNIVRYVYAHIGNRAEAEDIAGEVFLRALKSLKSYREQGVPMRSWLFRIAHNLTVDYLRKMDRRKTVPIDTVVMPAEDNPADAAEKNVEFERVSRAMEDLTPEQREVISLRFLGGLTSREVGNILHKSDGAVREMQRAALEMLRRLMGVER